MCILVITSTVGLLLIVSGDLEVNPGPSKKCPKCEAFVSNRAIKCKCDHTLNVIKLCL